MPPPPGPFSLADQPLPPTRVYPLDLRTALLTLTDTTLKSAKKRGREEAEVGTVSEFGSAEAPGVGGLHF
jgi:hypothetical protein